MPKVSVVIIAHNGAPYVGKAIESVLAQTEPNYELVVVDDGSTDGTGEVVGRYADSRLRYLYQENAGPSAARNTGIRNTTGEWIAFLDCDDWWLPKKLALQLARVADSPEVALVYGTAITVDETTGTVVDEARAMLEGHVLDSLLLGNLISGSSSTAMVRRATFDRVGLFDNALHYGEDWELWLRIAASYPVAKVDEVVACLLRRPESQGSSAEAMRDACIGFLEKAFETYAREHRHLRRRAIAEVYYRSAIALHDSNVKPAARRDVLQTLRCNPFRLAAYRRLVRLAIQS